MNSRTAVGDSNSSPSNVLILHSDEHRRSVLGCYGDDLVETPALDALADRGAVFENAYCNSPICVPSRASEATGRYVHEVGTWDNAIPYTGSVDSWGHRLTEQGHSVTTIGKLHFRNDTDDTGFPDQRVPLHVADGVGDVFQWLRADRPVRSADRRAVYEAGPGESPYTQYDRGVTEIAIEWLRREAQEQVKPWALYVSYVNPHLPLRAPQHYFDRYIGADLPMPLAGSQEEWPQHEVLSTRRRLGALDEPIEEGVIRHAIAAYYGMVDFLDDQIAIVLEALHEGYLADDTVVIYTSDHGEMLGDHGLWWKNTMYDASVAVPLIVSGPSVPAGLRVAPNVSLVDLFPTVVDAVDAMPSEDDATLPGTSLIQIANEPPERNRSRVAFSEYHAAFVENAIYMIRTDQYKYVHYVGFQPQLFEVPSDPEELNDLSADPAHTQGLASCEELLRSMISPEEVDAAAKKDQRARLEAAGGRSHVIATYETLPFSPPPSNRREGI